MSRKDYPLVASKFRNSILHVTAASTYNYHGDVSVARGCSLAELMIHYKREWDMLLPDVDANVHISNLHRNVGLVITAV